MWLVRNLRRLCLRNGFGFIQAGGLFRVTGLTVEKLRGIGSNPTHPFHSALFSGRAGEFRKLLAGLRKPVDARELVFSHGKSSPIGIEMTGKIIGPVSVRRGRVRSREGCVHSFSVEDSASELAEFVVRYPPGRIMASGTTFYVETLPGNVVRVVEHSPVKDRPHHFLNVFQSSYLPSPRAHLRDRICLVECLAREKREEVMSVDKLSEKLVLGRRLYSFFSRAFNRKYGRRSLSPGLLNDMVADWPRFVAKRGVSKALGRLSATSFARFGRASAAAPGANPSPREQRVFRTVLAEYIKEKARQSGLTIAQKRKEVEERLASDVHKGILLARALPFMRR